MAFSWLSRSDASSVVLLVTLYFFQGVLLTLFNSTIPLILGEQGRSITSLSVLSMSSYPFSMKIFLAPFVDTYYFKAFGQRRTYIVLIGYLAGIIAFLGSFSVLEFLEQTSLKSTAAFGFSLILLISTQDIAVDAWALKILSEENQALGPLTQSIGMTLGFLVAGSIFFKLNLPLDGFLRLFAVVLILTIIFIHFFVEEHGFSDPPQPTAEDSQTTTIQSLTELTPPETQKLTIQSARSPFAQVTQSLTGFYRNPHLFTMIILFFIQNIGVGPLMSSFNLRIQQVGISKERISGCHVFLLPFQMILPVILAKKFRHTLSLGHRLLCFQVIVQIGQFALLHAQGDKLFENHPNIQFFILFLVQLADWTVISSLGQARAAFFATIASKGLEGIYLTMLTSVQNISRRATVSSFQYFDYLLNFNVATPLLWLLQLAFIIKTKQIYSDLDKLPKDAWCLRKTAEKNEDKKLQ